MPSYDLGSFCVETVDITLQDRNTALTEIYHRLEQTQTHMKTHYDKGHQELEFAIGDYVWVRLSPYRRLSITGRSSNKLSPYYYSPCQVLCIGSMAYQLALPPSNKIYNVFHVSLHKPFKGVPPSALHMLPPLSSLSLPRFVELA